MNIKELLSGTTLVSEKGDLKETVLVISPANNLKLS